MQRWYRILDHSAEGEAIRVRIRIDSGCPAFDGHFPGHPVLPAIGQISIVLSLARRFGPADGSVAAQPRLASVDRLRLQKPVGPGDELLIEIEKRGPLLRTPFSIRRDGEPVTSGTLTWHAGGES